MKKALVLLNALSLLLILTACGGKITKDNMDAACAYNVSTGDGIKLGMTKDAVEKILVNG